MESTSFDESNTPQPIAAPIPKVTRPVEVEIASPSAHDGAKETSPTDPKVEAVGKDTAPAIVETVEPESPPTTEPAAPTPEPLKPSGVPEPVPTDV
jgi:hypothetical protein